MVGIACVVTAARQVLLRAARRILHDVARGAAAVWHGDDRGETALAHGVLAVHVDDVADAQRGARGIGGDVVGGDVASGGGRGARGGRLHDGLARRGANRRGALGHAGRGRGARPAAHGATERHARPSGGAAARRAAYRRCPGARPPAPVRARGFLVASRAAARESALAGGKERRCPTAGERLVACRAGGSCGLARLEGADAGRRCARKAAVRGAVAALSMLAAVRTGRSSGHARRPRITADAGSTDGLDRSELDLYYIDLDL